MKLLLLFTKGDKKTKLFGKKKVGHDANGRKHIFFKLFAWGVLS